MFESIGQILGSMETKQLLSALLALQVIWGFCLMISTFFVVAVPEYGFDQLVSSFVICGYIVGSLMILHRHEEINQKQLGLLMGLSFMVCVLTFQSGIYWAAHSHNTNQFEGQTIDAITVYYVIGTFNGVAMNSIAVFSFFMFFVELAIFYIYYAKGTELASGSTGEYDDIAPPQGGSDHAARGSDFGTGAGGALSYQNNAQTADL